jgi:hypothetical protein
MNTSSQFPSAPQPQQEITISYFLSEIRINAKDPLLTREQINALVSLTFSDSNRPILTFEDRGFLYEIIGLLENAKGGFNVTYKFLNNDWAKTMPGNDFAKRKSILFLNPLLEGSRKALLVSVELFNNNVEPQIGLYPCKFCGSENTKAYEMQIRSADEPAKITVVCGHCNEGAKGFVPKG